MCQCCLQCFERKNISITFIKFYLLSAFPGGQLLWSLNEKSLQRFWNKYCICTRVDLPFLSSARSLQYQLQSHMCPPGRHQLSWLHGSVLQTVLISNCNTKGITIHQKKQTQYCFFCFFYCHILVLLRSSSIFFFYALYK